MRKVAFVSLSVALLAGCAAKAPAIKMPGYQPGDSSLLARTPSNGIYQVKWLPIADGRAAILPNTTVYLKKGSPLGFKTADDRTPIAIGGDYELKLASLPEVPGKLVWCSASSSRDSGHFSRETNNARPPVNTDDLPGKREGLLRQLLTDPEAFWR